MHDVTINLALLGPLRWLASFSRRPPKVQTRVKVLSFFKCRLTRNCGFLQVPVLSKGSERYTPNNLEHFEYARSRER